MCRPLGRPAGFVRMRVQARSLPQYGTQIAAGIIARSLWRAAHSIPVPKHLLTDDCVDGANAMWEVWRFHAGISRISGNDDIFPGRYLAINYLRTADLARVVGIHPNTVRRYVERGWLPPVRRGANGYRHFT